MLQLLDFILLFFAGGIAGVRFLANLLRKRVLKKLVAGYFSELQMTWQTFTIKQINNKLGKTILR